MRNSDDISNKENRPIKRSYSSNRVIVKQEKIYNIYDKPISRGNDYEYDFDISYQDIDDMVSSHYQEEFIFNNIDLKIKPLSVKMKKMFSIVGVVICVIIVGIIFINFQVSPNSIGKKFIKAYGKNDYSTIYSCLYLSDSPFLTKHNFEKIYPNLNLKDINEISNIKVVKTEDKGTNNKFIYFRYDTTDDSANIIIQLKKTGKNKFIFFPEWKVYSKDIVAYDATITAPSNYQVSINDILLTDEMLSYQEESKTNVDKKTYKVDVFCGTNTVKASSEFMQDGVFEYEFYNGSNIFVDSLELSYVTKDTICNQFKNFSIDVYSEIVNKHDANNIKQYISNLNKDDVIDEYNSTLSDINSYSSYQITNVSLYNFYPEVYDYYIEDNKTYVKVQMDFEYKIDSNYKNYSGEIKPKSNSSNATICATYVFEDEEWKISNLDLKRLYL